ncbi:sensor histidine kinase [Undibacterium danionis]|uniref:Histidine kinase n=1 Tax=Undibacterium danionis TaxID=1812100 RepID=A0ABV6II55_9BURK
MPHVSSSFSVKYLDTSSRRFFSQLISPLKPHLALVCGLFACIIFGGFEFFELFFTAPAQANLHTPAGFFCQWWVREILSNWIVLDTDAARIEWQYFCYLSYSAALSLLFTALLWLRNQHRAFRSDGLFAVQLVLAVLSMSALLLVLAAQFAAFLPFRRALRFLVLLMLVYSGVHLFYVFNNPVLAGAHWKIGVFYLVAQLLLYCICFALALAVKRYFKQCAQLKIAYAELQATQIMLSDTVRITERTRIARDLHDILGHQLTALNLHLDLAVRHSAAAGTDLNMASNVESNTESNTESNAESNIESNIESSTPSLDRRLQQALQVSRELAHDLLAEVRTVVSSEKNDKEINLQQALSILCASIPQPKITLQFDESKTPVPMHIAHCIFYCVQEAITNVIRHADAKTMQITLKQYEHMLNIQIQDDGQGCDILQPNHGLQGMRERLQLCNGTLSLKHASKQGFCLELQIPFDVALKGLPT